MVHLLDTADLQCPEGHGQMASNPVRHSFDCPTCGWFVTQIEFLRNGHGTREQRRARVAAREIGRPA